VKRPRTTALNIHDPSQYGGAQLPPKHLEVLRVAMKLIAERGYRGASLRELARRVGMQQPSLYHYFTSKEDLVEQILVTFGFGGVGATPSEGALPERFDDFPALAASIATWLYEKTDWPHFVRLLFNIAVEAPKYQPRLRALFVETTRDQMRVLTKPYVDSGQVGADDAEMLTRMVVNAIGLPLIEQHLLFPRAGDHPDLGAYVAFVVRFASAGIRNGALAATPVAALPKVGSPIAEQRATTSKKPPRSSPVKTKKKRS
jgi:AcrR family transcriptional regulator